MNLEYGYATDIGLTRSHNEDAVSVFENKHLVIAAVADGMGGHSAGDVASKIAMDHIGAKFTSHLKFSDAETARSWIVDVLEQINTSILNYAEEHEARAMGTTLVMVMITVDFVAIVNIGDSRAYVLAHGELRQVTKDHTFVRELLEKGKISPRAAKLHPNKNVINNALGASAALTFDFSVIERYDLNGLLLTSDGLTGFVEDVDIATTLNSGLSVDSKVKQLIEAANEKGGRDNISVALVEFKKRGDS